MAGQSGNRKDKIFPQRKLVDLLARQRSPETMLHCEYLSAVRFKVKSSLQRGLSIREFIELQSIKSSSTEKQIQADIHQRESNKPPSEKLFGFLNSVSASKWVDFLYKHPLKSLHLKEKKVLQTRSVADHEPRPVPTSVHQGGEIPPPPPPHPLPGLKMQLHPSGGPAKTVPRGKVQSTNAPLLASLQR